MDPLVGVPVAVIVVLLGCEVLGMLWRALWEFVP